MCVLVLHQRTGVSGLLWDQQPIPLQKKKKKHTYEETDGAFYTTKKTKGFASVLEDDPLKERKGMI